jgi:hypothetical protein
MCQVAAPYNQFKKKRIIEGRQEGSKRRKNYSKSEEKEKCLPAEAGQQKYPSSGVSEHRAQS